MTRVSACAPELPACGQRALGRAGEPVRPPRLLPVDTPASWAAAGTVDANGALSPARRSASAAPGSAPRFSSSEPLNQRETTDPAASALSTSRLGRLFCLSGKAALDTLCLKLLQTLADRMATRWSLERKARPSLSEAGDVFLFSFFFSF